MRRSGEASPLRNVISNNADCEVLMASLRRTLLTWFAVLIATSAFAADAPVKALVGGRLIDGFGGPPIANSVILVRGDRIEAVGEVGSIAIPKGAEVISTEGMDVLPGLWDMHVHLMIDGHADYAHWFKKYPSMYRKVIMPASAHQLLMAGVTSARDLGAPLDDILAVRDAINRGEIPGPTMYVA